MAASKLSSQWLSIARPSELCRIGMISNPDLPDQLPNQLLCFGGGARGVSPNKISTSPPAKPHPIAHGDVSGRNQVLVLRGGGEVNFECQDRILSALHWTPSNYHRLDPAQDEAFFYPQAK